MQYGNVWHFVSLCGCRDQATFFSLLKTMSFHQFINQETGESYGSFEVFYDIKSLTLTGKEVDAGFYWWPCFPGCIPDGDAVGPFDTEQKAIDSALSN